MTLKKETQIGLSYGQILSTITLILMIGGVFISLSNDVAVLKNEDTAINNRLERHEKRNDDAFERIVSGLEKDIDEIKVDIKEIKNKK